MNFIWVAALFWQVATNYCYFFNNLIDKETKNMLTYDGSAPSSAEAWTRTFKPSNGILRKNPWAPTHVLTLAPFCPIGLTSGLILFRCPLPSVFIPQSVALESIQVKTKIIFITQNFSPQPSGLDHLRQSTGIIS